MIKTTEEGLKMQALTGRIYKTLAMLLPTEDYYKIVPSEDNLDTEDRLAEAKTKLKEVTGETDPDKVDLTGADDFMEKAIAYARYCKKMHGDK